MSSSSTVSWFDDEAQTLRNTIDEFGERFALTPYRVMQVNFSASPDPARRSCDFWAVYERDAKDVAVGMEEVRISTRHLCVTAMVCDVPNIRQGDRLTHFPRARFGDMTPGEVFEVTDARPDGLSGIEIRMVQLGRAKQ